MSSDDRTDIPTLRKATKDLAKAGRNELEFNPIPFQERVKARFYRRLEELSHRYDKETVFSSSDLTVQLAGTDRILKWLEDPAFASWFLDADYVVDTIASQQQRAIKTIMSVMNNEDAHDGDRLKAARMLVELNDLFPGRKQEIKFLDERLNNLSESETEREIKQLSSILEESDESKDSLPGGTLSDDKE
jgi:hypothetical protein